MFKFSQNQYICFVTFFLILFLWANPCSAAFTIEDEKKLGKEFYDNLEDHQLILKNRVLNEYINKIGNLVLAQTRKGPFDFNFFIVNSSAINAFATPGGYIYINKGLITSAKSEAELAGVIAHEIAHANARHIASIIDKSTKLNIASLTAILAGILLGGGGEAMGAITAFSLAGSSSLTLKYMREHEEEADRMGLQYLVSAGYDPMGILDFLKMMKQYEFLSKTMPSYLQTHPVTDDRIFYLDSLILSQHNQKGRKNIVGNLTRMQALVPQDTSSLNRRLRQLEDALKTDPDNLDLLYTIAFTEDQLGQLNSALFHYEKALRLAPLDQDVLRNLGLLHLKTGNAESALIHLQKAENVNPQNDDVTFALGRAYFAVGNYRKALECYLKLKDKVFDDADINYFIAMTYGNLNDKGSSHYYFGLHCKKTERIKSALFHFKEALNYFPKGSERYLAIEQQMKDLDTGEQKKTLWKR